MCEALGLVSSTEEEEEEEGGRGVTMLSTVLPVGHWECIENSHPHQLPTHKIWMLGLGCQWGGLFIIGSQKGAFLGATDGFGNPPELFSFQR